MDPLRIFTHVGGSQQYMLPAPITFAGRRRRSFTIARETRPWKENLLARSRVTNLTVTLLLFVLALSALVHLRSWIFHPVCVSERNGGFRHNDASDVPKSIRETVSKSQETLRHLRHLIMVPGHAIWAGSRAHEALDEHFWLLESYQRGSGRVDAFVEHIRQGAELAEKDESSLLIFSGGQTRSSSPLTEGTSYLSLALASDFLPTAGSRATTENFALDSFQNLLFSIARFHEVVGNYPEKITVVGYEMKRRRFEELHRAALRWPLGLSTWDYIGNDPGRDHIQEAYEGERINGYVPYTKDMYGCHGELLQKRRSRNVFNRFHSYHSSNPQLIDLFEWCPDGKEYSLRALFPGTLPWES